MITSLNELPDITPTLEDFLDEVAELRAFTDFAADKLARLDAEPDDPRNQLNGWINRCACRIHLIRLQLVTAPLASNLALSGLTADDGARYDAAVASVEVIRADLTRILEASALRFAEPRGRHRSVHGTCTPPDPNDHKITRSTQAWTGEPVAQTALICSICTCAGQAMKPQEPTRAGASSPAHNPRHGTQLVP